MGCQTKIKKRAASAVFDVYMMAPVTIRVRAKGPESAKKLALKKVDARTIELRDIADAPPEPGHFGMFFDQGAGWKEAEESPQEIDES